MIQVERHIYASAWQIEQETLWTIVNRGDGDVSDRQIKVSTNDERNYYDCYHGDKLPVINSSVAFTVEAWGIGCVFATPNVSLSADTEALFSTMRRLTAKSINSYSKNWSALQQTMVPIPKTKPHLTSPHGMVSIPAVSNFTFIAQGVEIEGQRNTPGPGDGVDFQMPWEPVATPYHKHTMSIDAFFIDRTPVTQLAFSKFLDESGFIPKDPHNFLQNWTTNSSGSLVPYVSNLNKPVVHVSLNEAREFCTFYNKRLPHTWEFSYAAAGTDGRPYPWGFNSSSASDGTHCPKLQTQVNDDQIGLAEVTAFPNGASPFGVLDLVGNVWQYTDEFYDEHTRSALLRGGSQYVFCS